MNLELVQKRIEMDEVFKNKLIKVKDAWRKLTDSMNVKYPGLTEKAIRKRWDNMKSWYSDQKKPKTGAGNEDMVLSRAQEPWREMLKEFLDSKHINNPPYLMDTASTQLLTRGNAPSKGSVSSMPSTSSGKQQNTNDGEEIFIDDDGTGSIDGSERLKKRKKVKKEEASSCTLLERSIEVMNEAVIGNNRLIEYVGTISDTLKKIEEKF